MSVQREHTRRWVANALAFLVVSGAAFDSAVGADYEWNLDNASHHWTDPDHWAGPPFGFPADDGDTALVRLPSVVDPRLGLDRTLGALTIQSGGQVFTGNGGLFNYKLGVRNNGGHSGMTLIEGFGSSLTVYDSVESEDFDTDDLTIGGGATLTIADGARVQVDRSLRVNTGGRIRGHGVLELNGNDAGINDGTISAEGGTLRVEASGSAMLNADGLTGDGILEAIDGDLDINFNLIQENFNGTARVGPGRWMDFSNIYVGDGGLMLMEGIGSPATFRGTMNVYENAVLRATGAGIVDSVFGLHDGTIEVLGADSHLYLNNFTGFSNGNVVGAGTLHVAFLTVSGDTTISVDTFDMDGVSGNTALTVNLGASLRVESPSIESSGDGYDGTLDINSSTVDIVAPWVLEGTVNLHGAGFLWPIPRLMGDGGVTVDGGQINFSGGGIIETPIVVNSGTIFVEDGIATVRGPTTLGNGATIEIEHNGLVRLQGETTLLGPTINGAGVLSLDGEILAAFVDTTIGSLEADLDGTFENAVIRINSGVVLGVNSTTIETIHNDGFDGTIHNAGTFSVLAGWRLDGTLNMDPVAGVSRLDGAGPFEIFDSGVVNAREAAVINPDASISGTLNVTAGQTQLNGTTNFASTASVNITSSGELELNGTTTINGGNYNGEGTLQWDGPMTVAAVTTMTLGTVDLDGTSGATVTTVESPLTLNVDQVDTGNNSFDGTLNFNGFTAGMRVNLNDPNAAWRMDGTINASGGGIIAQNILQGSDILVSGTINVDSIVTASAALDVSGSVHTADVATEFRLSNGPHVVRNTATVDGLGTLVVNSDGTVLAENDSTIAVDVINQGRFEPGPSISIATIGADYTQAPSATLAIELDHVGSADQHDVLRVDGVATLSGELEATALANFVPTVGAVYTVLTANDVVGTFDTLTIRSESPYHFESDLIYPGTRVVLQISDVTLFGDFDDNLALTCDDIDVLVAEIANGGTNLDFDLTGDGIISINDLNEWLDVAGEFNVGGAYLPGDANLDGTVDGQDFETWNLNKFTATPAWCSGDFNADGIINGQDFLAWNSHKFLSSWDNAAVPEPTVGMLSVGWLTLLLASRQFQPQIATCTRSRNATPNSRIVLAEAV